MMSIGFSSKILRGAYVTGPFTLAALLMGADEVAMATMMNPDELDKLCKFTTAKIREYVRLLIVSGAQIICILEPSGVMLASDQFEQYSGKFVRKICDSCNNAKVGTVYHACCNSMHLIEKMVESGVDTLSLDSPETGVDITLVAKRIPEDFVIIGNINPFGSLLNGSPEDVERDVLNPLKAMEFYPNFILSTGCDLP